MTSKTAAVRELDRLENDIRDTRCMDDERFDEWCKDAHAFALLIILNARRNDRDYCYNKAERFAAEGNSARADVFDAHARNMNYQANKAMHELMITRSIPLVTIEGQTFFAAWIDR